MAGGTLIDYLETVPRLTSKAMADIMSQVLSALVYCHDRGVIHRDVKLENVFVSSYSHLQLKLADFGLAVILNKGKTTKGAAGTLLYMAPEVFHEEYNQKADVWSCGVLFYMIVFGKPPYHAKNSEEMLKKAKIGPLFYNWHEVQDIDEDLFSLLDGMLKTDPKERLSAKDALKHLWIEKNLNKEKKKKKDFSKMTTNLMSPCKMNKLQKNFAVFVIWKVLDSRFFYDVQQFFKEIDKDGNGTIDKSELMENFIGGRKQVEEFFKEFDLNHNGIIEFTEFALAACEKHEVFCEKFMRKVFREIDCKSKGFLTKKQILRFFGIRDFGEILGIGEKSKIFYEDFKELLLEIQN
jgi:calcium-dependent protein kinase